MSRMPGYLMLTAGGPFVPGKMIPWKNDWTGEPLKGKGLRTLDGKPLEVGSSIESGTVFILNWDIEDNWVSGNWVCGVATGDDLWFQHYADSKDVDAGYIDTQTEDQALQKAHTIQGIVDFLMEAPDSVDHLAKQLDPLVKRHGLAVIEMMLYRDCLY